MLFKKSIMSVFMRKKKQLILQACSVLLVVVGATACNHKPPYQANISNIQINPVTIERYEEVLFNINPLTLREDIEPHIDRFHFFIEDKIDDPASLQGLYDYVTDPLIKELYLDTRDIWPDLSELEASLTEAFRYYRSHLPDMPIPKMYSYISGLDYHLPIKYANNHLVIGLDMYLGRGYPKYRRIGIPAYQTIRMDPAYVLPDVMRMMGEKHLQQSTGVPDTFLDYMIYEGKLLYFMDCMLPQQHDTLKIGFTRSHTLWMQQNRGLAWSYYLENEMLYSTDRQMINKFIGDTPFTAAFSRESAPRTAVWIGWQIVREYMRRHPDVSLPELLQEQDAQKILHESRYRGR